MKRDQGLFITVEGGDGAGKTTVLALLKAFLDEHQVDNILTREPGGIEIAEKIRSVILDPAHTAMDPRTEALLYAAARRQHLVEKVIPAVNAGKVVLCDRFVDSSVAYQGYGRQIGVEDILSINQFAVEEWEPDLTLYFDIPPEVGLARINANKEREVNRLDLEANDFHYRVHEGYRQLAQRFPDRIVIINANQPIEAVTADAKDILRQRLSL
ncbi:dTMP kinase [Brevibacillus dissolubilis]|uniref:dTMP kinase n=1 Tax=Brevibacillus dissolubilis TaxID=1844116 RepID=UPI0021005226|nr:dTMP kinase [Brevibacillus dissolubilis]